MSAQKARYSDDQPRNPDGTFGEGGASDTPSGGIGKAEETIMGHGSETALCWDKEGNLLPAISQGAPDSVEFSAEQLGKLQGGTLAHNHPPGTSFSVADVEFAGQEQLKELRVCGRGPDGMARLFSMRPGEKGWPRRGEAAEEFGYAWRAVMSMADNGKLDLGPARFARAHEAWKLTAPACGLIYTEIKV
jgi:hypothetical protein